MMMTPMENDSLYRRAKRGLLGGPRGLFDPKIFHNLSLLALFVAAATVLTVFIISGSYAQIIEAFPSGGGGYIVASKLLGEKAGVVSGSALVIDYALTITISVASGGDAGLRF